MEKEQFEGWAIVELFGHQVVAGYVSTASLGGASFVRVDVPAAGPELPAFTKLYGAAAIYALTPTDETTAMVATETLRARPISPYVLNVRQLSAPERVDRPDVESDRLSDDIEYKDDADDADGDDRF
jgi:hypothetical protein